MKKINLHETYVFGKTLAPLASVTPQTKTASVTFQLWDAREKLLAMSRDDSPLLSTSKRAAAKLIAAIDKALSRDIDEALSVSADVEVGWLAAPAIKNGVSELEYVLGNDMPDIASYVASQKGIFRTDDLIAHAEHHLSAEVQRILPAQAKDDLREAGRCLAYELPTACAFHLWRAVESSMDVYFKAISTKSFDEAGVQRNWAAKIKALNGSGADDKITLFLDHIRDRYRNPQTHPDEPVAVEEAQRLFSVASSAIEQMLLAASQKQALIVSAVESPF